MQQITLTGPRVYEERPKLWERIGAGSAELEAIRKFMLQQLDAASAADVAASAGQVIPTPEVSRRIRSADDILALWYLRCDLYQAILGSEGEEMAAEKLQPVTHQFVGLIPSPLRPRSTRLGGMPAANVDEYLKASEE